MTDGGLPRLTLTLPTCMMRSRWQRTEPETRRAPSLLRLVSTSAGRNFPLGSTIFTKKSVHTCACA